MVPEAVLMVTEPDRLLARLTQDIGQALGEDLRGLYVYGSWVTGDFYSRRSDLDLLAVLAADPTEDTLRALTAMHDQVAEDHPDWVDRIEVEYLSTFAMVDFRARPRPMVRISPGEPLHLVPATRHHLLNWYVTREQGLVLHGPAPRELIPPFADAEFHDVVREHAAQWPQWVRESRTPGGEAYAVLTVCRALFSIREGGQVSKLKASYYAADELPDWADLIGWARRWWYEAGTEAEPSRSLVVTRFVDEVSGRIVGAARGGQLGGGT